MRSAGFTNCHYLVDGRKKKPTGGYEVVRLEADAPAKEYLLFEGGKTNFSVWGTMEITTTVRLPA